MSARCTTAVFERYPVGGGEFALALALADNAHSDGRHIFPGIETMAQKSRQSVRAVQNHLRNMLASGWLELVKNGRGGRGVFAEYRINADWLNGAELAPFSRPPETPKKGAELGIKRVQIDAQKGAELGTPYITGITVIEPPLPPKGGECGSETQKSRMRELACATAGAFEEVGFDAVAALYLRKDYMLRARKQWERLAPSPALQRDILESIKLWNRSPRWQAENGRYIPKLANWLRNELWADAPGVVVPSVAVLKAREPDQVAAPIPEHVRKLRASFGRGKVQAPAINEASNKEEVEHAD